MVTAIFPAAGQGKRMQAGMNKVFMELAGMPIFIRTLLKFSGCDAIDKLIVVVGRDEVDFIKGIIGRVPGLKPYKVVAGGSERQYSVRNGLAAVDPETEVVLVHDAARPLVSEETILATIEAAKKVGGAVAGVPAKNTIKVCDDNAMVQSTPDRRFLWEVQTPQGFRLNTLMKAHELAAREDFLGTDEASLVERMGEPVQIVMSDYKNIKITTPEDIVIAEACLRSDMAGRAINTVQEKMNDIVGMANVLKDKFFNKRVE